MAKSGAQSLTFKSVMNKQTDIQKTQRCWPPRWRVKCEPHQTWHGYRGPRAHSMTNIYFPIFIKIHLPFINATCDATIVSIATYTVQRSGPAVDACVRADAAARRAARGKQHELPLCRHFWTVSKYVRVSADALV